MYADHAVGNRAARNARGPASRAMKKTSAKLVAALLAVGFLSACAPAMLAPDDRKSVCQVAVEEKVDVPVLHANPLSNPAGGVVGAGAGAVAGLIYGGMGAIIAVPLGAVIGAIRGTACGVASVSHPDAETVFDKILRTSDAGTLRRALQTDLNVPPAGCSSTKVDTSTAIAVDAVIEIEKVDVGMGCAFGKQEYWISVKWRAIGATTRRVLGETTTRCSQTSYRDVDEWSADPDQAQVEIERVLAKTGQRMAAELRSSGSMTVCRFRSSETGEIEEW
jgi:outer membrane lipoprotein SlyB